MLDIDKLKIEYCELIIKNKAIASRLAELERLLAPIIIRENNKENK